MARILIVDDNDPVRWVLGSLLQAQGHAVIRAADGAQALLRCESQRFDLVLMDVYMPSMDGLEVCRLLRQASEVPILVLSTSREPSIEEHALACGANAFTLKPLNFDRLLGWISNVIADRRGMAGGAPPQAPLCFA